MQLLFKDITLSVYSVKMAFIYLIRNKINNKYYIGETIQDIKKRWKTHLQKSSFCTCLKRAFQKHGIKNFEFKIIIIVFDEDRFKFESEYIKKYNSIAPNGYNLSSGGASGFSGCNHSDITKDNISNSLRLYYSKEENIEKAKQATLKKKHNKIYKKLLESEKWQKALKEKRIGGQQAISIIQYDLNRNIIDKYYSIYRAAIFNKFNRDSIDKAIKIKKIYRNFYWEIDNNQDNKIKKYSFARHIIQYDLLGNKITEYDSIKNAALLTNCRDTSIIMNLKGRINTSGGFIWKYKEEEKEKNEILTEIKENNKNNKKKKMITQYDLNNNKIRDFDSIKEATKFYNYGRNGISNVINGKKETYKNFKWKIYEENL